MFDDILPHVVPLKGGSNFRDLGGYRTADGRTVRRSSVFRSAHLGTLTDEDRAALSKLGVRTIVDLRGVSEAAETPHLIDGVGCRGGRPYRTGRRRQDQERRGRRYGHAAFHDGALHRPLPRLSTSLRAGFPHAVRDPERRHAPAAGVPLHRRQGPYRLRLGPAAHSAGRAVGRGDGRLSPHQRPVDRPRRPLPELDIDTRAAIIEARTPYLEAAFDVVRGDFGSSEAFAEKALGLDGARRASGSRADLLEG